VSYDRFKHVCIHILTCSRPRLEESEGWSKDFRDFLEACLQKDPRDVSHLT
jgi:hypothetical protein